MHQSFPKLVDNQLDLPDGALYYIPNWLSEASANKLFECLQHELEWQQGNVKVFGAWHPIPRLQAWYGDSSAIYGYSGKPLIPLKWHSDLHWLREKLAQDGIQSNAVLANFYRNGNDKVGWHSDNEKELGCHPVIASISLGATRTFQLKHKQSNQRVDLELESGSLLVMAGNMQTNWLHALPQRKRITNGRINLTYRMVKSGYRPSSGVENEGS